MKWLGTLRSSFLQTLSCRPKLDHTLWATRATFPASPPCLKESGCDIHHCCLGLSVIQVVCNTDADIPYSSTVGMTSRHFGVQCCSSKKM
jgi:hypothetical protein